MVGERVSSMLRGAKVTGEKEGKEEDTLGPAGREHPPGQHQTDPLRHQEKAGSLGGWIYFIVFYLQGWTSEAYSWSVGGVRG